MSIAIVALNGDLKTNHVHEESHIEVKKTSSVYSSCKEFFVGTANRRNFLRVSFAGGLSMIGGIIASDPRVAAVMGLSAIFIGSFIGGVGNGASTYLAWETGLEDRVSALEARLKALEDKV